jgi:hypothetical protein
MVRNRTLWDITNGMKGWRAGVRKHFSQGEPIPKRAGPPDANTIRKQQVTRRNKRVKVTLPKTPWDDNAT